MNPIGLLNFRKLYFSLFLIIFLQNSLTSYAQKYPYKIFTIKDGLSAMQCTSVFQDSRGFLWITTKNGLNRFDGKTFKKLYTQDGLVDNAKFSSIVELPGGEICFMNSKFLMFYDNTSFKKIPLPKEVETYQYGTSLFFNSLQKQLICITKKDNSREPNQVFVFDLRSRRFKKIIFDEISYGYSFSPQYFDPKNFEYYGVGVSLSLVSEDVYKFKSEGGYEKLLETYQDELASFDYSNEKQLAIRYRNTAGIIEYAIKEKKSALKKWLTLDIKDELILINTSESDQLVGSGNRIYYIQKNTKELQLLHEGMFLF